MKKSDKELKNCLQKIINASAEYLSSKQLLKELIFRRDNTLYVKTIDGQLRQTQLDYEKIIIVGGGKVSHILSEYLYEILSDKVTSGFVAIKSNFKSLSKIRYFKSAHPKANISSLKAADEMIDLLKTAEDKTLVIFVISGGCSALLAKPIDEITFEEKADISEKLINSGADINELNKFRKYFSKIKGGGILDFVKTDFISIIIADVIGNPLKTIASGLTYYSKPSNEQVKKILEKYGLANQISSNMQKLLKTNYWGKFKESDAKKNFIIFDNLYFQKILLKIAEDENIYVHRIRKPISGDVAIASKILSSAYTRIIRRISTKKGLHLIISGGETSVKVKGNGLGGRNHELSLLMINYLSTLPNAVFISLATDGDDGNSNHAGAFVTSDSLFRIKKRNLQKLSFLQRNDSFSLFDLLDDEVSFPKFITNVMDVQLLLLQIY